MQNDAHKCVCVDVSTEKDLEQYPQTLNVYYIWIVEWDMILLFNSNFYCFQKPIKKSSKRCEKGALNPG